MMLQAALLFSARSTSHNLTHGRAFFPCAFPTYTTPPFCCISPCLMRTDDFISTPCRRFLQWRVHVPVARYLQQLRDALAYYCIAREFSIILLLLADGVHSYYDTRQLIMKNAAGSMSAVWQTRENVNKVVLASEQSPVRNTAWSQPPYGLELFALTRP